jgi:hypothetical protein
LLQRNYSPKNTMWQSMGRPETHEEVIDLTVLLIPD